MEQKFVNENSVVTIKRPEPGIGDKIFDKTFMVPVAPNRKNSHDRKEETPEMWKGLRMSGSKPDFSSAVNVKYILTHDDKFKGKLRYNQFKGEVEFNNDSFKDDDQLDIAYDIEDKYYYSPSSKAVEMGIKKAAKEASYDPVKNWITRAKWDENPRVDTFFIDYLGADDDEYTRAVTREWFIALIARVYKPGIKFDMVPILVGNQGIGKSSLVSALAPKDYFEDELGSMGADKDDVIKANNAWIIEIAELSAMSKTSIEKTKAYVSATFDKVRRPYGHVTETLPRHSVFIGSTNQGEFLKDQTGNRRFYPIKCHNVNRDPRIPTGGSDNEEFKQVLAEAKHLWDQDHNQRLRLPEAVEKEAARRQQQATQYDTDTDKVLDFVEMLVPENWDTFTMYRRKAYFDRYQDEGDYSTIQNGQRTTFTDDQLHRRDAISTKEILEVVFGIQSGRGRNGKASKVSMIMLSNGWVANNHVKLFDSEKRGYQRIN